MITVPSLTITSSVHPSGWVEVVDDSTGNSLVTLDTNPYNRTMDAQTSSTVLDALIKGDKLDFLQFDDHTLYGWGIDRSPEAYVTKVELTFDIVPDPVLTPVLAWNADQSALTLSATAVSDPTDDFQQVPIKLYWSTSPTFGPDAVAVTVPNGINPVPLQVADYVSQGTEAARSTYPLSQLNPPPADATFVLAVADPDHTVTDPASPPVVVALPYTPPAPPPPPATPATPAVPATPRTPTVPATDPGQADAGASTPSVPASTTPGTDASGLPGASDTGGSSSKIAATFRDYIAEINQSIDAAQAAYARGHQVEAALNGLAAAGKVAEGATLPAAVVDGAIFARGAIKSVVANLNNLDGLVLKGIGALKAQAQKLASLASTPSASTVGQVTKEIAQLDSEAGKLTTTSEDATKLLEAESSSTTQGKSALTNNQKRLAKYSKLWQKADLNAAIESQAGPNPATWRTATGKTVYENPATGRQVVVDEAGYFRIYQPSTGRYFNLTGELPTITRKVKGGALKTLPLVGPEFEAATHFLIE